MRHPSSRTLRQIGLSGMALLAWALPARGQEAVITGRVTGPDQVPIVGATVALGQRYSAITGPTGSYTLSIPGPAVTGQTATVIARMIGYRPSSRSIQLTPGPHPLDFTLEPDPLHLEELVVTGVSNEMAMRKLPFSVGVVRAEEIQQVPGVTALDALQGRVAGVNMLQSTGIPGAPTAIRIRGYTSVYDLGQPPLIIIDGTIARMTLSDLAAEDIERVEVLKGAAATSYYGSEAANGVIQVFTRRGTGLPEGKLVTTARFEGGASFITRQLPTTRHHYYLLDSTGQFVRTAEGDRIAEDDLIMDNPYPVYHDFYDEVFRPGGFYTASFSLAKRSGPTSWAASFQQTADEGPIVFQDGFNRQNYRINLDQALTTRLDLSLSLFYSRSRSDGQANAGLQVGIDLWGLEPHMDITEPNADGTPYNNRLIDAVAYGGFPETWNPLYDLTHIRSTTDRTRFTGGARLRWRTNDWLTLEGHYNGDAETQHRADRTDFGYLRPEGGVYPGDMNRSALSGSAYNTGVTGTGIWSWGTLTNTTRLAYLYEDQSRFEQGSIAKAMIVANVPHFGGADPSQVTASSGTYAIKAQNLFASTTFDIRDRYLLDALVRRDGSSLFGAEARYSTYFRVSGSWRVTEDVRIPGLDELRLRASYGTAGLRPGFNYQYELLATRGGAFFKQDLGNARLRPAHSGELEVGANLAFGQGRYAVEYNYSRKETRDQMVQQNLHAVAGFPTQWANAGTLLTRTHELSIGMQPVRRRNVSLILNLSADRMRSAITEWPLPEQRAYPFGWYRRGQDLGIVTGNRFVHSIEELYHDPAKKSQSGPGQAWSRDSVLVNELGDVVRRSAWRTVNEQPIQYLTCQDPPACTRVTGSVVLGRVDPDFTVNLATTFNWRRLSLSGVIYWWQGGLIYNWADHYGIRHSLALRMDQSGTPPAERKPASYWSACQRLQGECLLEPGTFVKIRELALNYTFVKSDLRRVGLGRLNELRLGLAGRNLFAFTGFTGWDPEVGGSLDWNYATSVSAASPFRNRQNVAYGYPLPRTLTASLEIAF